MASLDTRNRSRSPRFPSHSIKEAMRFVSQIYDGVHRSTIEPDIAYQLMGFSGKSGASAKALGSIRQYGFIEGVSHSTRVSDLALRILEPVSENERIEAIFDASREPEVFNQIFDRFDQRIPNADEPVRAFLIRELGFSKKGAEDCLASFRETISFVEALPQPQPIINEARDEAIDDEDHSAKIKPFSDSTSEGKSRGAVMRVPLTRECSAELAFSGEVSEKALQNLIRHIELMVEVWEEDQS